VRVVWPLSGQRGIGGQAAVEPNAVRQSLAAACVDGSGLGRQPYEAEVLGYDVTLAPQEAEASVE
jgi:hypothetical protein